MLCQKTIWDHVLRILFEMARTCPVLLHVKTGNWIKIFCEIIFSHITLLRYVLYITYSRDSDLITLLFFCTPLKFGIECNNPLMLQ